MVDINELLAANQRRWPLTQILADKKIEVEMTATRLVAPTARNIYRDLEIVTRVPWWVIAVIHEREASQAWWANIANGEPWNRMTKLVPKGRGPFANFRAAAIDALTKCPLYTLRSVNAWTDWSAGGTLVLLEMYNGFGYETFHHENSPYIWSATNYEEVGKYVADGQWDPKVWDAQLGCAALLLRMSQLDPTITLDRGAPDVVS